MSATNKYSLGDIWVLYLHMLKPRYNSIPCIQHISSVCNWIKEFHNDNLLWFSPLHEKCMQKRVLYYWHQSTFEILSNFNTPTVICEALLCASTKVVMKFSIGDMIPINILFFKQEKYNIKVSFLNILVLFKSFPFLLFFPLPSHQLNYCFYAMI